MDGANFGSFLAWKSINVKVRNYKPEVSDSILRSNLSWLIFVYIFCSSCVFSVMDMEAASDASWIEWQQLFSKEMGM